MSDAATPGATSASERTKPYAWLVLFMLAFIYIFNFLDRQLMSVLIQPIKADLGFTDEQMGYMTGFWFALFYTGFGVIVGFLADRTSRRNILFAGAFLWSIFTALCGFAKDYPTMLVSRIGVGVGEAAGAPPSYSIISDYFPPHRRAQALALFSLGVPFGQAAGVAFGAKIDGIWGWETAFISIGIAGAVAAVLMLLIVREPKRGAMDHSATVTREQAEATAAEKSGFFETFWEFINRPALLWAALGCGFSAFVGYVALTWNAAFMQRTMALSSDDTALWYASMLLVSMGLGTWVSGALTDFLAKRSKVWYALVPGIAMGLSAPFWYFFVMAPNWQTALVILSAPTFLTIMYLAPALALIQNSVKPSQRTMAGAILLMVLNMIGLGGGPTLAGAMSSNITLAGIVERLGISATEAGALAKMTAAQLKEQPAEIAAAVSAASNHGLQTALLWITPFYAVAVFFILLEAFAIHREVKAGGPVRDGGARLGIVLLAMGVAGFTAMYLMKPLGVWFADWMGATQIVLLALATGFGLLLCFKALGRRNAATA